MSTSANEGNGSGGLIVCPICLHRVNWENLPLWRWDPQRRSYAELVIDPDGSPEIAGRARRAAVVRCPGQDDAVGEHYLPADYGGHGKPVVIGFIGSTRSGKTHLLSAMVGAIEAGGLAPFGATFRPVDHALHATFLADRVRPLLHESKVLDATPEGVIGFVNALLVSQYGRTERTVALFDVAGGDLNDVHDAKRFLDVADGLVFVVDPTQLHVGGVGDQTFSAVLGLLRAAGLPVVSAAVVLNKADLVRFADPVALWLRSDVRGVDPESILRESADVYAYLHKYGMQAWTRPYSDCGRATLHVASATGGADEDGVYPRGVTPRRALPPLVALLVMTGVLDSPVAADVGI